MKVYLIKNVSTNKYYLGKYCWSAEIFRESYFTRRGARWHRTHLSRLTHGYKDENGDFKRKFTYRDEDLMIEEYNMVKTN